MWGESDFCLLDFWGMKSYCMFLCRDNLTRARNLQVASLKWMLEGNFSLNTALRMVESGRFHYVEIGNSSKFHTPGDLLGWLSDPFKGLSDLQLGDEKVTLNHLAHLFNICRIPLLKATGGSQLGFLEVFIYLNFVSWFPNCPTASDIKKWDFQLKSEKWTSNQKWNPTFKIKKWYPTSNEYSDWKLLRDFSFFSCNGLFCVYAKNTCSTSVI